MAIMKLRLPILKIAFLALFAPAELHACGCKPQPGWQVEDTCSVELIGDCYGFAVLVGGRYCQEGFLPCNFYEEPDGTETCRSSAVVPMDCGLIDHCYVATKNQCSGHCQYYRILPNGKREDGELERCEE